MHTTKTTCWTKKHERNFIEILTTVLGVEERLLVNGNTISKQKKFQQGEKTKYPCLFFRFCIYQKKRDLWIERKKVRLNLARESKLIKKKVKEIKGTDSCNKRWRNLLIFIYTENEPKNPGLFVWIMNHELSDPQKILFFTLRMSG